MQLLIEELKTTPLLQEFEIEKSRTVKSIRFRLLKYGNPAGSVKLEVLKGARVLRESILSVQQINDGITEEYPGGPWGYFHGLIRFNFDLPVYIIRKTKYTIRVSAVAPYVFSEVNYIAGIKDHEFIANTFPVQPPELEELVPYGFEIWNYQENYYK